MLPIHHHKRRIVIFFIYKIINFMWKVLSPTWRHGRISFPFIEIWGGVHYRHSNFGIENLKHTQYLNINWKYRTLKTHLKYKLCKNRHENRNIKGIFIVFSQTWFGPACICQPRERFVHERHSKLTVHKIPHKCNKCTIFVGFFF